MTYNKTHTLNNGVQVQTFERNGQVLALRFDQSYGEMSLSGSTSMTTLQHVEPDVYVMLVKAMEQVRGSNSYGQGK